MKLAALAPDGSAWNEAALHSLGADCISWEADGPVVAPDLDLSGYAASAGAASKTALLAYAAAARYAKEIAGLTVAGVAVATDRVSQAQITGAWATVQANPGAVIQWKAADGSWSSLNASQITALANAISAHVQACFAAEATLDAAINASPPTVTATAAIDAAFAAL